MSFRLNVRLEVTTPSNFKSTSNNQYYWRQVLRSRNLQHDKLSTRIFLTSNMVFSFSLFFENFEYNGFDYISVWKSHRHLISSQLAITSTIGAKFYANVTFNTTNFRHGFLRHRTWYCCFPKWNRSSHNRCCKSHWHG